MAKLDTTSERFPDVVAVLERARGIGESSCRVGIALGLPPAELARIERALDTAADTDGYTSPSRTHLAEG